MQWVVRRCSERVGWAFRRDSANKVGYIKGQWGAVEDMLEQCLCKACRRAVFLKVKYKVAQLMQ